MTPHRYDFDALRNSVEQTPYVAPPPPRPTWWQAMPWLVRAAVWLAALSVFLSVVGGTVTLVLVALRFAGVL